MAVTADRVVVELERRQEAYERAMKQAKQAKEAKRGRYR